MAPPTASHWHPAPYPRDQRPGGNERRTPQRIVAPGPHDPADPAWLASPHWPRQHPDSAPPRAPPQRPAAAQTCRSADSGCGTPSCLPARRSIPTLACEGPEAPRAPARRRRRGPHVHRPPSCPCHARRRDARARFRARARTVSDLSQNGLSQNGYGHTHTHTHIHMHMHMYLYMCMRLLTFVYADDYI